MAQKLAVALGLREKTEKDFTNMVNDMTDKFVKKQGLFIGGRQTFEAMEGFADEPEKRKFQNVASTVKEQLNWFKDKGADYLKTTLSIEKTNAGGIKAPLVVAGETWGEYTTLELLRLKGILDSKLKSMIQQLPIRSESQIWEKSTQAEFQGRDIWQTRLDEGYTKTTLKDTVIINDPHIKEAPGRSPITKETSQQVNTGKYTKQDYSGAITNRERAEMEVAYNDLYKGVIAALEQANSAEVEESDLGDKVLGHLFN